MTLTGHRDGPGRQISACGRYAVQNDGWNEHWIDGIPEYGRGNEWAAILIATDENLDWFDTMRDAKACAERHANESN